ncbi:MAG: TonB C-terminal domain-containing protein [Cyanobacteria bacterium SZAS LIN-5]|nr:TonB C-terminal domain-containing protein [Cyanobacteria bacterium SZAS LIN-5]
MSIVRLSVVSLSALLLIGAQGASAFPTISKERFVKQFNKEKAPPPLVIRDKWAVLIGLTKYRDSKIATVRETTPNLAILSKIIKDPNAGRFVDDHITTLFDVQATKKYSQYLLTEGWLIKKALPNDLILIYVCGRASFTTDDAILCTYDTVAGSPIATGLSLTELLTEIHRRTQSKNIICITDLAPLNPEAGAPRPLWQNMANAARVTILASNLPGQPSYQSNDMGTTLFTHYFVEGLKTNNGAMNFDSVAKYVCQSTETGARETGREQHPQYALLNENHELGAVAIGVPVKANPHEQSRLAFGHPIDQLALTRPDLLVRAGSVPPSAPAAEEGAKELHKKPAAPDPDDDDDDVQDIDYSAYMDKMKKDIQAKWKPPKGIEQRRVGVTFRINRDGSIVDGTVVESSGVDAIDQSALEALKDASPIDPLPKGAPRSVEIRYRFDWKVTQ